MNGTVLNLGTIEPTTETESFQLVWSLFEGKESIKFSSSEILVSDVFLTYLLFILLGIFMVLELFYIKYWSKLRTPKKLSFISETKLDATNVHNQGRHEQIKGRKKSYMTFLSPTSHLEVLLNSAQIGNTESILQLYNKSLDLTLQDKNGNTALHLAAKNGHQEMCRMLVVLSFPIEIDKMKNSSGETAMDLAEEAGVREDLKLLECGIGKRKEDIHSTKNDKLVAKSASEWPKDAKFALSMDGGGVKVLVLCQTLLHLDKLVGGKLVDKIDWIGGTSCGGVLALNMGCGRSLEQCRHFFISNVKKVFCGNTSAIPKHNLSGIMQTGKDVFKSRKMDSIRHKMFVTVSDTRKSPAELVLFRSYTPKISSNVKETYGYLDPSRICVWKAARCTSAAPYFFESFNGLSDGGITANNPTQTLISEILQVNTLEEEEARKQEKSSEKHKLGCVVSLGTGVPPQQNTAGIDVDIQFLNQRNPLALARGLMNAMNTAVTAANMLLKEITSSNGQPFIHSRAWAHSLGVPFFRFSPKLKEDYAMDETNLSQLIELMWETELYLRGEARKDLEQFALLLSTKPPNNYNRRTSNPLTSQEY